MTLCCFLQALVDSLSVLVKQEREESAEQLTKLTEEMEEVLGELAMLEDQDQKRQEMLGKSQEVVRKLQEEHDELEMQLRESRALLERYATRGHVYYHLRLCRCWLIFS